MAAKRVHDTKVYQLAFKLAMGIFEMSKNFPAEEIGKLLNHMINNPEKY